MTVKSKYTIANCDQGKSKFGQGKSGKNQGICFLKLCGHPDIPHCWKFHALAQFRYFPMWYLESGVVLDCILS